MDLTRNFNPFTFDIINSMKKAARTEFVAAFFIKISDDAFFFAIHVEKFNEKEFFDKLSIIILIVSIAIDADPFQPKEPACLPALLVIFL